MFGDTCPHRREVGQLLPCPAGCVPHSLGKVRERIERIAIVLGLGSARQTSGATDKQHDEKKQQESAWREGEEGVPPSHEAQRYVRGRFGTLWQDARQHSACFVEQTLGEALSVLVTAHPDTAA